MTAGPGGHRPERPAGRPARRPVRQLTAGMRCPNCGFAALVERDGGHLACPVCGLTTSPPNT